MKPNFLSSLLLLALNRKKSLSVIKRYLKIKHKINISEKALEKRKNEIDTN